MSMDGGETKPLRLSGGFWRRVFAATIDLVLILSVYQIVGMSFYDHGHGRYRMNAAVINTSVCNTTQGLVGRNQTATHVRADQTTTCVYYFFGFEYNRTKQITQVVRDIQTADGGRQTEMRWETYYVDPEDRRVEAEEIDDLKGPVCLFVLFALEAVFATTVGKALLDLKIVGADGRRPGLFRIYGRNLLLWGGWAILGLLTMIDKLLAPYGLTLYPAPGLVWALLGVSFICAAMPYLSLMFSRPHPYYDDWAGVQVVRKTPPKPPSLW